MKPSFDAKRPNFNKAQNAATALLLQQNLSGLFFDVRKFSFNLRILIDSVQNYAAVTDRAISDFTCDEFSGCCVMKCSRCNVILYDDREENDFRKHWGIAHEVGHLYLGHESDGQTEEIEAHFFAAQITMPEIIMYNISSRLNGLSPFDITGVFNASYDAACKRIQTFKRRHCFNCSDNDIELLRRLMPELDAEYPPTTASSFWQSLLRA